MTNENETLIATWTLGEMTYKFFEIERDAIDEDSDEGPAYDLVGIETQTNVRRINERFDSAYSRDFKKQGDDARIDAAIESAPDAVHSCLMDFEGWSF